MIVDRNPLMAGLRGSPDTALWRQYNTVMGAVNISNPLQSESFKYAVTNPVLLAGTGDANQMQSEAYKFATTNPALLAGLGDAATDPAIVDTSGYTGIVKDLILAWNTQQIQNANTQRIAMGLAPLDPSAYAPTVNVGLSPEIKMMLLLALGAAFLLMRRA